MSFFSFNIAGNALDAYQQAMNVTSDNISNVSTPGASRQSAVVTQGTPVDGSPFLPQNTPPSTQGEGAVVNQIARIHEDSYDSLYRGATSSQYYYTTEQTQLTNLQSAFGEPSNGINSAYAALQSSITQVASQADQSPDRSDVLAAAQKFATALNTASSSILQQETSVKTQAGSAVTKANSYIDQIATLNGQIRALTAAGNNPNTYLDQRDYAIDQLSQIVNVTSSLQSNGSTLISIDGRPIVSDTVTYHLAQPVIGTSANGTATFVVGFAGDPSPSNPTPVPLGSGQLGAFADLYNNKLATYGQQLDNFASATANEMNRITSAGVDLNQNVGTPLFKQTAGTTSITAATIAVATTDPTQLPLGLISTSAGSLTTAMNSADNTVSTAVALDNNLTLRNPPSGALTGTLTVAVDGANQTFSYNTGAGGNADTIADFMTNFNAGHYGVTASYDQTGQTIVFTRDPNNTDLLHRALQGANATTAEFTITDSNTPPATLPAEGVASTGLLETLGASKISGVAQTPFNAYGTDDNGDANALIALFSQSVGVGALQTTASAVSSPGTGSITITQPAGVPGPFSTVNVGQVLTIVNPTTGATQNVPVTAVNRNSGTITVTATATINVGDAITTARSQTLGGAYQNLVTQMGLDTQTATTGVTTQTALSSSIDQARQSVDGINIDEETQNLLKYQSAYTAAAKTLTTLNTMMQTTLDLISGG